MIKILLATHCDLAESLVRTGKMICGNDLMRDVCTITIKEDSHGLTDLEKEAQNYYEMNKGNEFLLLCDIVGASPFNTCASIFRDAKYVIVTGVNLPMLIEAVIRKDNLMVEELAEAVEVAGKQGIEKIQILKNKNFDESEEDFV